MLVKVDVNNVNDLFALAGGRQTRLAKRLGVTQPTVSAKLAGRNSWYEDEIDALVAELNDGGAVRGIDRGFVVKLLGAVNIKLRGTLADKEVQGDK